MAATTVSPRGFFPVGTAVEVYKYNDVGVQRREHNPVNIGTAEATGTIAADGTVAVTPTSGAGIYTMVGTVNEVQSVKVDATAGQFNQFAAFCPA